MRKKGEPIKDIKGILDSKIICFDRFLREYLEYIINISKTIYKLGQTKASSYKYKKKIEKMS